MDRRQFIGTVGAVSAAVTAAAVLEPDWAAADPTVPRDAPPDRVDERFLDTLTAINDLQVPSTLATYQQQIDGRSSPRTLARSALRLVSGYANPRGARFHDEALLGPVSTLLAALTSRQNPSGLYDVGNLDSPPDSSFVISDLGLGYEVLLLDDQSATEAARTAYGTIMRRSATSLMEGGVHTPNHRWEVCKALSHLNHLWPSRGLKARINEWLSEGIDQDREGEYSERSPNYASEVTNPSLLITARLADRPDLRDAVSRNLALTLYRIEPNGEVETVQSRRQDQTGVQEIWKYLTHFRELALRKNDRSFARAADQILDRVVADPARYAGSGYSVGEFLAEALAYPDLTAVLPSGGSAPSDYAKRFSGSDLVRIRRDVISASIFGGTDYHNRREDSAGASTSIREIASGLSTNPTFFKYRKGEAILDSVRLSPTFFSTGHFRSDGLSTIRGGWQLSDTVKVPYHLPLRRRDREHDGDYDLGSEGRFYSKMSFADRPKDYKVLETTVTIKEGSDGAFTLDFDLEGPATTLTIELCFRAGGTLDGVVAANGAGNYQLVDGQGSYTMGDDTITFGPGNGSGTISMDPGEKYTYLQGSLVPPGMRVYVTGVVPFRYALRIG